MKKRFFLDRRSYGREGCPNHFVNRLNPCEPSLPLLRLASLKEQVDGIPEAIPLLENANGVEASQVKEQLRFLRAALMWGWYLPLSLLGLVMALVIRSREDLRRWWGVPLLLTGAVTFVWAVIGSASRMRLARAFSSGISSEGSLLQPAFQLASEGVLGEALGKLYIQAVLLLVAGAILWFGLRRLRGSTALVPEPAASRAPEGEVGGPPPVRPLRDQVDEHGDPVDPPSGIFG